MPPPLNGAVHLPGVGPQQAAVQIAAPMNDIQLIVLAAAAMYPHLPEPDATVRAGQAVQHASEIVAVAVVTNQTGCVARRIQELKAAWAAEQRERD